MNTCEIPKTPGACVDRLELIKTEKSALNRQIDELDRYQKEIVTSLQKEMGYLGISECSGTNMRIRFVDKTKYSICDKKQLCNYMIKEDAFDLMTVAVNQKAVSSRLSENEEIPGISNYELTTTSLTKRA